LAQGEETDLKLIPLFIIILLAISGAFIWMYKTNTFQIGSKVSYYISDIPYVSNTLGLDRQYMVNTLIAEERGEIQKYKLEDSNYEIKNKIMPHNDRYLDAFTGNTQDKSKISYPATGKKEYSPEGYEELAQIYTSMEPKQAALILEKFDDDIIINIFSAMKPKVVADILTAFAPERAGVISIKILEKKQVEEKGNNEQ
jgi:hypothetical protein